jgi:hypothetical protein
MGEACSTYNEEQKCIRGFGGNSLMERDILIKCILRIGWAGVDWIDLAHDRDRETIVYAVLKFRIKRKVRRLY